MFENSQDSIFTFTSKFMQAFSVAQNENGVFIYIDRTGINTIRLEQALRHFEYELSVPSHLEAASDEEQAEIAALLGVMTDDDKEIASTERVVLMTEMVI